MASNSLPGSNLVTLQFNGTIILYIAAILMGSRQRRHSIFEWLITVVGSLLVCSGTLERVWQIHGFISDPNFDWRTTPSQVRAYFYQSLAAWIACIIVDGRHTVNILQEYGRDRFQWQVTLSHAFQLIGLLSSCVSMLKFAHDVYYNFTSMTDDPSIYFWFFMAVIFKILRILVQGLVLTMGQHESDDLTKRLMFSSIFLTIQVLFLAQFSQLCSLSMLLLMADLAYRSYQCYKIACIMHLHTKLQAFGILACGTCQEAAHSLWTFSKQLGTYLLQRVQKIATDTSKNLWRLSKRLGSYLLQRAATVHLNLAVTVMTFTRVLSRFYAALPIQLFLTTSFMTLEVLVFTQYIPLTRWAMALLMGDLVHRGYLWWKIARHRQVHHRPLRWLNNLFQPCRKGLEKLGKVVYALIRCVAQGFVLDNLGVAISIIAICQLSTNVYDVLKLLAPHPCCLLFFPVIFKMYEAFKNGIVIPVKTQRLKEEGYRRILKWQMCTKLLLTVVMILLSLSITTQPFGLSTSLKSHILYRFYQLVKVIYFYCRNHDTCSDGNPCCPLAIIKNRITRILPFPTPCTWHAAETKRIRISGDQARPGYATPPHHEDPPGHACQPGKMQHQQAAGKNHLPPGHSMMQNTTQDREMESKRAPKPFVSQYEPEPDMNCDFFETY